jgi:quercetin dioxygenase-like cupin family protein
MEKPMFTIQTQNLELTRWAATGDRTRKIDADWPLYRDRGAASTAVVYFELEPGMHLGRHTDSAEELLIVLQGEIEAVVGAERKRVGAGGMALVPSMVPHDVVSVGNAPAKVLGVFSSNTVVSTFDEGFAPDNIRVVGTPMPVVEAFSAAELG